MKLLVSLLNALLVVFVLDGVLGLVDETIGLMAGRHPLFLFRAATTVFLTLGAPLAWLALFLSPKVPKTVHGTIALFMLWRLFGALPLPLFTGLDRLGLSVAILQLVVGVFVVLRSRQADDARPWLLSPGTLTTPPVFTWRNALLMTAATFVVLPVALLLHLFWSADLTLTKSTAGFASLSRSGLEVTHRTYARDDKTVDLIGMVHVGDQEIYETLFADISPDERTLLLAEGVQDTEGHLGDGSIYGRFAGRLGLSAQGPMSELTSIEVRNADLDVREFAPETLALLDRVFAVYRAEDPLPPLLEYFQHVQEQDDPEALMRQVLADVLTLRNEHLVEKVGGARVDHDRHGIPRGADHRTDQEAELLAPG
ncbi:MAG: hypothetical protein AAF533_29365, partial [Acidobacteriota bacterium]